MELGARSGRGERGECSGSVSRGLTQGPIDGGTLRVPLEKRGVRYVSCNADNREPWLFQVGLSELDPSPKRGAPFDGLAARALPWVHATCSTKTAQTPENGRMRKVLRQNCGWWAVPFDQSCSS
jgi:hypothetical protein